MNTNRLSLAMATTALVIAAAATGGPALAGAIASNSDKVDGLHAVKSNATVQARKGKLVATSPTTGLLPNNIIARAPDSAKLNGFTHAQLRSFQIPAQGSDLSGGAALTGGGAVLLPNTDTPSIVWTFMVPRTTRQARLCSQTSCCSRSPVVVAARSSSPRLARKGR